MRWFVLFLLLANVALFFWLQQQSRMPPSASPSPDIGTLRLRTEQDPAVPAVAVGVPDTPSRPESGGVPVPAGIPDEATPVPGPSMAEPLATPDSIPVTPEAPAVNAGVSSAPLDDHAGSMGETAMQGSASLSGLSEPNALDRTGADGAPTVPVPGPVEPVPEDRSGAPESSTERGLGTVAPAARESGEPVPAERAMPPGPALPEASVDVAGGVSDTLPSEERSRSSEQASRPVEAESLGYHEPLTVQAAPPSEGPAMTGRPAGQEPPGPDPSVAADQSGPLGSSAGPSASAPPPPLPDGSGGAPETEVMPGASGSGPLGAGGAIESALTEADALSGTTNPAAPVPVSSPTPVCFRAGPFAPQEAEDLAREMPPEVSVLSDSPEDYPEVTGYYVLIPPLASRTEGIRKLDQLRAAGIKDVWLFRSGELNNAISLGLFSREPTARRHAANIGKKGFATEVRARTSTRTRHWLALQAEQGTDTHRAIALPDGAALEPQPCP